MTGGKQTRCPDCDGGTFTGDGRCSRCYGTGVNLNLVSADGKCPPCRGTGVCATCGGSGLYPPEQEVKVIHTLFNG